MELLNATSEDGKALVAVAPYVAEDGKPGVAVFVRKGNDGLVEGLLDGKPAFVMKMSQDASGSNAPWILGDQLVAAWQKACEMAAAKTRKAV